MINEAVKDSGDTQEFDTGAHRDDATGKGRCDLLPLEFVSACMYDDPVIKAVADFMEHRDIAYLVDAIRASRTTVPRFTFVNIAQELEDEGVKVDTMVKHLNHLDKKSADVVRGKAEMAYMMLEASKIYEAGAIKYGSNNWQLGMPVNRYIDSGVRHYLKTLRGDIDEPHYRGFLWNLLCAMWTAINKPELNYKELPVKSDKAKDAK